MWRGRSVPGRFMSLLMTSVYAGIRGRCKPEPSQSPVTGDTHAPGPKAADP